VDNAVKFSPDGTPVDVTIASGRVTIRDHGPGLADADVKRIFDRFYRSDAARQLPGSGLGLSIVHDVVTRCGGTVFAGNHPAGGAVIGFVLPPSAFQPSSNPH
jgi:two-component system sensor histidine kinase MprB